MVLDIQLDCEFARPMVEQVFLHLLDLRARRAAEATEAAVHRTAQGVVSKTHRKELAERWKTCLADA